MKRLYQWFSERASFFLSDSTYNPTSRTIRTEMTVQREAMTLLVSEAGACDICPLCGQKVASPRVGQTSFHRQKASTSPGTVSGETPSLEVNKIRACETPGARTWEPNERKTN